MKSNLPEGWALTTLGAICQKAESVSPTNDPKSTFQYIDIASIDNSIYRVVDAKEYLGKDAPSRARQLIYTADTLISTVRPYLRKIAFVTEELNGQIASTGFTVVRAKEGIDSKYVFYHAISDGFINSLCEKQRGASYPAVRDSDVFEQEIPLAPLAEQRRIVAQLDAAMQQLEASQARLEKLPKLLKQFRQAVLSAAVAGRLTEAWRAEHPRQETGADLLARIRAERRAQWEEKQLAKLKGKQLSLNDNWKKKYEEPAEPDTSELPELPEGWAWAQVGDAFDKVSDGPFGSNLKGDDYTDEPGFQVIRLENIGWMEFIADKETFISEEKFFSLEKHEVFEGDIIFSSFVSGNIRAVLLKSLPYRAINKADCFCLRGFSGLICQGFLIMALSTERSFNELVANVHGSTRPRINTTQLKELTIPFPSFAEQQEIVRQVNHYFALADALEARFEQAAAMVEQLPQALLSKAFSGQLVLQDPNDEPASALLGRLRNAPASAKAKRERILKSTSKKDTVVPQPLLDILTQHPDGISPEKLFSLAGFTDADVDTFYQELAALRPRLMEEKPTGEAAKTWPKKSTALRLKPEHHAD